MDTKISKKVANRRDHISVVISHPIPMKNSADGILFYVKCCNGITPKIDAHEIARLYGSGFVAGLVPGGVAWFGAVKLPKAAVDAMYGPKLRVCDECGGNDSVKRYKKWTHPGYYCPKCIAKHEKLNE